jgi:hypothetical protein
MRKIASGRMSKIGQFINQSLKKVTRCASEAKPDQSEAFRERIDMAKPQQADCHLFEALVNILQIMPALRRSSLSCNFCPVQSTRLYTDRNS